MLDPWRRLALVHRRGARPPGTARRCARASAPPPVARVISRSMCPASSSITQRLAQHHVLHRHFFARRARGSGTCARPSGTASRSTEHSMCRRSTTTSAPRPRGEADDLLETGHAGTGQREVDRGARRLDVVRGIRGGTAGCSSAVMATFGSPSPRGGVVQRGGRSTVRLTLRWRPNGQMRRHQHSTLFAAQVSPRRAMTCARRSPRCSGSPARSSATGGLDERQGRYVGMVDRRPRRS